jgi:hypothetical protein
MCSSTNIRSEPGYFGGFDFLFKWLEAITGYGIQMPFFIELVSHFVILRIGVVILDMVKNDKNCDHDDIGLVQDEEYAGDDQFVYWNELIRREAYGCHFYEMLVPNHARKG